MSRLDHDAAGDGHEGHHDAQHHVAAGEPLQEPEGGESSGGGGLEQGGKTTLVEVPWRPGQGQEGGGGGGEAPDPLQEEEDGRTVQLRSLAH